ncbi:MAG TPA: TIGR02266 family protein [Kofleriaceae bacterium]|nr:TIGR02266 family protein [Kofleriaceae bacterium]
MDEDDTERDDRRRADRHPIELKVEYQRLNTFFSDYTKNISKGGTFIKTDKPLGVGTEFVFKLYVPHMDEPIKIRGQVQWVVTAEDLAGGDDRSDAPGMGIHFIFRGEDERDAVEKGVEKLMVDSLGQLLYSRLMEHSRRPDDESGDPTE